MRVLDLFSGLGGWSETFVQRGHEVFTVDWEASFKPDLAIDIRELSLNDLPWLPDIVLASPPCEKFSVMTIGRYWNLDNTPKDPRAQEAIDMVKAALKLIQIMNPAYWVMENPRGKLRKLDFMQEYYRTTVTYCQLGENFMKPTDLWGRFPESLELPAMCKNGMPCHVPAARGTRDSINGSMKGTTREKFRGGMIEDMSRLVSWSPERKNLSALRAKIPAKLSLLFCEAAERDLEWLRKYQVN